MTPPAKSGGMRQWRRVGRESVPVRSSKHLPTADFRGDTVYRTYNTQGRGVEQVSHAFSLVDLLPYGRQEEWQDVPNGWPQHPTYSRSVPSEDYARYAED